ncbi:hypothetical protein BASA81_005358 [Batrachochytrium salamandrivorans]|nr:hypothetical protein BASA81_005358 [Batrachochytrium salamandrivorans]
MDPILTGQLSFDKLKKKLIWDGLWSTPVLNHSSQTFRYTCQASEFPPPPGALLELNGSFCMTDAKSRKKSQVQERAVRLEMVGDGATVTGQGSNRFGRFELAGHLDGNTLQVRRIYLPGPASVSDTRNTSTSASSKRKRAEVVPADVSYLPEVQSVLQELRKRDKSEWFAGPVNTSLPGLERYAEVVSHPMDFGTIQKKLDGKQYGDEAGLAMRDLKLVFANAKQFNPKGTVVHRLAQELGLYLETRLKYLAESGGSSKRVRVAKKFFQHVNELDNADLYYAVTAAKPAAIPRSFRQSQPLEEKEEDAAGFDSFDELDELSDFEEGRGAGGEDGDAFLTDSATPASGGELSPFPCPSPAETMMLALGEEEDAHF